MGARLNPILKYGDTTNEKSKGPVSPPTAIPSTSPFLFLLCSLSIFFPTIDQSCVGGDRREVLKERARQRKREKENGQEGRVREMRDQGAGGAKQRQTALVGGVNQ